MPYSKKSAIAVGVTTLLAALVPSVSAHASIVAVHGSNGKVGVGYGVNTSGKFPRKPGQPGDAGADVSVFNTNTPNPDPVCGKTGYAGVVDTDSALLQAEGFGLPAAYPNGSVVATVFQVNRDGGGPMKCEYSSDASLKNFQPMIMDLDMAGNGGFQPQDRVNSTIVATFPSGAKCTGGNRNNACVIRCRTGINVADNKQYRFGGCFAVQLAGGATGTNGANQRSNPPAPMQGGQGQTCSCNSGSLSQSDLTKVTNQVIAQMKQQGLVYKQSSSKPKPKRKVHKKKAPHPKKAGHHGHA